MFVVCTPGANAKRCTPRRVVAAPRVRDTELVMFPTVEARVASASMEGDDA